MENNENEYLYDVFISYRREGGANYARMLDLAFKLMGVKPFFDREELKGGRFDEAIYRHIEHSHYFLFILSKDALNRCNDGPEDWVRRELEKALQWFADKDGRIVIATPEDSVKWPQTIPDSLKSIKNINVKCVDFDGEGFVKEVKELLAEYLKDVVTEDKRIKAAEDRRAKEQEFYIKALLFVGGTKDNQERERLNKKAKELGISEEIREQLIANAKRQYEEQKRKDDSRFLKRAKRFLIRLAVILGILLIVVAISWYKGYRYGRNCGSESTQGNIQAERGYDPSYNSSENESSAEPSVVVNTSVARPVKVHSVKTPAVPKVLAAPKAHAADEKMNRVVNKRSVEEAESILKANTWNGIQTYVMERDLRSLLSRKFENTSYIMTWSESDQNRIKNDTVTRLFVETFETIRREPLALKNAGMRDDEITRARPDLVVQVGDVRHYANSTMRKLIQDGKHMEALSYYEAVKTAFKYCGVCEFDRPDFSQGR